LIGLLLAVMAAGLLLVLGRDGGDGEEPLEGTPGIEEMVPTVAPPTPIPNPVVVAVQRIPRGTLLITSTIGLNEWVQVVPWPQGFATEDALISIDQVDGRIARSDIPRGTILTSDMLTEQAGDLAATGSDAALLIPPDRVGIAIPVDHISSVGWALRRGDHVDVLVSFLFVDLDEEFQTQLPNQAVPFGVIQEDQIPVQGALGRFEQDPFGQPINVGPGESPQRPRLVSQITVRDAEVLNVGPWLPWGELFRAAIAAGIPLTSEPTAEGEPEFEAEEPPDDSQAPDDETGQPSFQEQPEIITAETATLIELLASFSRQPIEPLLLTVSPQDALVLKWAGEMGGAMHIVLRSHEDAGVRLPDTEPVTMQYMVDRFNIGLPPGLAYGIEPAVRELERSFLRLPEIPLDLTLPTTSEGQESPPR
jgi:Flp pilus assembly protein CpaB